ncbi:CopG family transcriptional regulator [Streptomyces sp. NPDC052236]|uniref:CopG family transcriptional regulator n=1 Tax=Streptomyces sp. NPDC052236 TaxID=3365686 RepID=UPI0037D0BB7F
MATKKVTITIPEELLDEIRSEAGERGLSAYVTEALERQREHDRMRELVDWLEQEHGPITKEAREAALAELDEIDAEHDRRRAQRDVAAQDVAA